MSIGAPTVGTREKTLELPPIAAPLRVPFAAVELLPTR